MSKMITPEDVLRVLLELQSLDEDSGDVITNLKAQKLLYYVQGVALAKLNRPMFQEDFVAWQYGPVIVRLYNELKQFGRNQVELPPVAGSVEDKFSDDQLDVIASVYKTFGQFSAWKLRDMTHAEAPWLDVNINDTIPKASIEKFFKARYCNIPVCQ